MKIITKIKEFLINNDAVAAIEFAISLPLLLLMFYGMIELNRYSMAKQQLYKATYKLADSLAKINYAYNQSSAGPVGSNFAANITAFNAFNANDTGMCGTAFNGTIRMKVSDVANGNISICSTNFGGITPKQGKIIMRVEGKHIFRTITPIPFLLNGIPINVTFFVQNRFSKFDLFKVR